jgi:hypothetical protein
MVIEPYIWMVGIAALACLCVLCMNFGGEV